VDTESERSLHFNYSHQLSRKSNHEFSYTLLNQLFQEQQPSNQRNTIPPLAIFYAIIWSVVIGGGGVDTERSLHFNFNYSHQLSRKSYTQHSTNNSHLILSRRGAAAIVVEPLPSSWSRHHHC